MLVSPTNYAAADGGDVGKTTTEKRSYVFKKDTEGGGDSGSGSGSGGGGGGGSGGGSRGKAQQQDAQRSST